MNYLSNSENEMLVSSNMCMSGPLLFVVIVKFGSLIYAMIKLAVDKH